jgi:hypothetical protein
MRVAGLGQRSVDLQCAWLATVHSGSTTLGKQHSQASSYSATVAQRQRYGPLVRHHYSA